MQATHTNLAADERAGSMTRPLRVVDLGTIAYADCWELQKRLAHDVAEGLAPDTLLLLEHPHTYTCGRRGGRDHILIPQDELARQGITVLDVDRGGDVTYHGPGQLVAYPVVRLASDGVPVDYPGYVRRLERVLISTLADFAIAGYQIAGYSGVWIGPEEVPEKIAAVGVKVDGRGVSSHGIAINLATDLFYFRQIVPCGITDKGVTSMERLLPEVPSMEAVKQVFARHFAAQFGFGSIIQA
jgi:lipoyl(octanoyl) transferase